jgi:hypothetical protein
MRRMPHAGIPYSDRVLLSGRGDDAPARLFFSADDGLGVPPLDVPLPASSKFPLAGECLPRRDGLVAHVLFAADRYWPEAIGRLRQCLFCFFGALVSQRDRVPGGGVADHGAECAGHRPADRSFGTCRACGVSACDFAARELFDRSAADRRVVNSRLIGYTTTRDTIHNGQRLACFAF